MNLINLEKIISNNTFLKLVVLSLLLCSTNSAKALVVDDAPWLVYGIDGLTYMDGEVFPSQDPNSQYVPGAYFVDYGQWSKIHGGPASCEASCAAKGRKCVASFSSFDQGEKNEDLRYDIFYCSGDSYGNGVFGVAWAVGEFSGDNPAKEACRSKGATLNTSYSGDNYYWGGIALCQPCTFCGGVCGGSGDTTCQTTQEGEQPTSPEVPIKDSSCSSSGSGSSGSGSSEVDEVDEDDEEDGDCSGYFRVLPEQFNCSDNVISDVEVEWKVSTNDDLVTCRATTTPTEISDDSFWKGTKSLEGEEGPEDIDLSNIPADDDSNFNGVSLVLGCYDADDNLVWSGADGIEQVDPWIYDPTMPDAAITLSELDGSPLNTDGPNGETVAKDIKVSWSCPERRYSAGMLYYSTADKSDLIGSSLSGEINFPIDDGSITFILKCLGMSRCDDGGASASVSNIVPEPIIKKFYADPKVVQGYEKLSTTVHWESENTEYCIYEDKQVGVEGSDTKVFPDDNKENRVETLDITCYDKKGRSVSTTTDVILKYPPRIISFTATPSEISIGESVTFNYEVENANYCWIGSVDNSTYSSGDTGSGSFSVDQKFDKPGEYKRTLTCKNDSSYTDSKDVTFTVTGTPCEWISNDVASPECDGTNPNEERVFGCVLNDTSCVPTNGFDKNNPPEGGCGNAGECPPNCSWYTVKNPLDIECTEAKSGEDSIPQMIDCILQTKDCLGAEEKPSDCITGSTGINCLINPGL